VKTIEKHLQPNRLVQILLLALPFMILDIMVFPFLLNSYFIYTIPINLRIPLQLILIIGGIVVFALNLCFLKILKDFTAITPVRESKVFFRGAVLYVILCGLMPLFIEIMDFLLIINGVEAFPSVIFDMGQNIPSEVQLHDFGMIMKLELLGRLIFFTINLLGGAFLGIYLAFNIYQWKKILAKETKSTLIYMIPGYLSLSIAWLSETIKVNLLYWPLIIGENVGSRQLPDIILTAMRVLDLLAGGGVAVTVIFGVISFKPVFSQLTEDIDSIIKKAVVILSLSSPVILIFSLIFGWQDIGLGSSTRPPEASLPKLFFIIAVFLAMLLVGLSYFLISRNLRIRSKEDDYYRNFMIIGAISALVLPFTIGIPEPEIWFGTVFTPFLAFMAVGCIYIAGVIAGVNSSFLENVRKGGSSIEFLNDVEKAIQIENLARETERVLRTAIDEIKERTKITPQINPKSLTKAFKIGVQSALNEVELDEDMDTYIAEALELYEEIKDKE